MSYVTWNLPIIATNALSRPPNGQRYELFLDLNPYYLRGLFDADTIPDYAVQVRERTTGKRGIAIVHGSDSTVLVLGAGMSFNGGDDFAWLWVWRVERRGFRPDVQPGAQEMLFVGKPESGGGLIWWDGTRFRWTQHGD
jgi:hypothetical protein